VRVLARQSGRPVDGSPPPRPLENLFRQIDLGLGGRAFLSGGAGGIGRHAGAGNTYWNLKSQKAISRTEDFSPHRYNFVAINPRKRKADDLGAANRGERWIETIRPGQIEPADLHSAQLARRLGDTTPSDE
jgi:hypothetical protein